MRIALLVFLFIISCKPTSHSDPTALKYETGSTTGQKVKVGLIRAMFATAGASVDSDLKELVQFTSADVEEDGRTINYVYIAVDAQHYTAIRQGKKVLEKSESDTLTGRYFEKSKLENELLKKHTKSDIDIFLNVLASPDIIDLATTTAYTKKQKDILLKVAQEARDIMKFKGGSISNRRIKELFP